MHFNAARRPNYGQRLTQLELCLAAATLMDTQRYEGARIPENVFLAHKLSARSSRSAWTASLLDTFPVGIFRSRSKLSRFCGSRIFPEATRSSSSSLASSAENGTNFATGRFRSRITISSPPLANVRYLLSLFLSSAILTLRTSSPHSWLL